MISFGLLCLILALVFALLAGFNVPSPAPWGPNWLALAFALFVLSFLARGIV
jgi:hypothetical protein